VILASIGGDAFEAILQGLPPGTVYALIALGFVLTYKTSGVFNLAFGAQAYVSAVMYYVTHTEWGWPIIPSLFVSVVLLAPLVGLALEWLIFRHLRTASAVSKLVVTIGLSVALPPLFDLIMGFDAVAGSTPEGIVPDGASVYYDPFGVYAFSRNELVAMAIAVAAMAGLAVLFRFSAIGLRMRAVVESPRMTEMNGIKADRVSAFAWMLSSFFAGLAGVLIAPRFNTLASGDFLNLVVIAVAAAAVGKLVSLPRALAGGLGLGILIALFTTFVPKWSDDLTWLQPVQDNLTPAIPFIVLFGVIIFVPSIRQSREARDPLSGVDPPPPSLGGRLKGGQQAWVRRAAMSAFVVLALGVVLTRGDDVWILLVTQAVVMGIIFLSITVMTGFAGQISLCQGVFAATGAFATYQLVTRYEMSVIAGALIGALIAAAVGALLSLPLRRLTGIWVAIATLAFAFFFDSVLVQQSWVGGGADTTLIEGTAVPRPIIGPWDFTDDKAFLVLTLVVLVVVALLVVLMREGTIGLVLRALRGSEVASQSIGISPGRARLLAFALSAAIAGLGGALLAMQQEDVAYATNFTPFAAMFWLVLVVTLGARTVEGAVTAAATFSLFDAVVLKGDIFGWLLRSPDRIPGIFPVAPTWTYVLFGLATIQYARHPEGLIEASRRRAAARSAKRHSPPHEPVRPAPAPALPVKETVA
jgi:branched-subunit amino acid ABC-type transport system permease component